MTLRPFALGQGVLVRATVGACKPYSAIVRIPMMKLDAEMPLEVHASDIVVPASTDEAYVAAQLMIARLESALEVSRRVMAELYEAGGHALAPPQR